ncbi:UDP-forming cellulose synthase catalytic subunit [Pseudoalteromonas sp. G4]|uniref:UDP-forming cellulose synthase catalytic subunit n=1 Tax=Pseudoalteromonas sp. G4 TaxID=2992761 RepID=UPI00237D38B2|nr:UDP-forming cellulose synthase catalytic subunit [Pseudoalteromonas sp. G4]MDE3271117.1 UDP-forming cellulose synthase catalytic subunit [Pseudoalteromonas sp. G4]
MSDRVLTSPQFGISLIKSRYNYFFEENSYSVFMSILLTISYFLLHAFIKLERIDFNNAFYRYFPQLKPNRFRLGDPLRFMIQLLFLTLVKFKRDSKEVREKETKYSIFKILPLFIDWAIRFDKWFTLRVRQSLNKEINESTQTGFQKLTAADFWENPHITKILLAAVLFLLAIFITVPFSLEAQAIFVSLILFIAYSLRGIEGPLPTIVMITLSVTTSTRYIWWRFNETLNWGDPIALFLGFGLLAAEAYAWFILILGFFQTIRPLKRKPVKLPKDTSSWPTVDVYIPTYNEPLSVVKPTTISALALDWPEDKLNVYILDDGKRDEFKQFAAEIGVGYIVRPTNFHAKAGNLNHAMRYTDGDLIAIFDCDHVPVRSFLQMTIGQFVEDPKMCLVQTPHHFFSADPFEKNLGNFAQIPNENMLFYGLIQDGNDLWDATFFCGSCAVIRRSAIEEIGGFAFETVTEDAHTALKMQRKGYRTAYINIPQAAGLATDSLSTHVGQRIRWARGMAQIFRVDNPLLGRGLSLSQRFCYLNAAMHFFSGIPRIVFLTAPLALIYFDAYIIYAPFLAILLYVVPTLMQVKITNSRIQGKWRYSFWGEVYEAVLAWYILKPTTVALFAPNKGKFNVTEKGGLTDKDFYDWEISKPYLFLATINLIGLIIGVFRIFFGDPVQIGVLLISMAWALYNFMILGAAIAVAAEAKQVRRSHRISADFPAAIRDTHGRTFKVRVTDFSDVGVGVSLPADDLIKIESDIELIMSRGRRQFSFPCKVINARKNRAGLILSDLSLEQEKNYIESTFSRADAWLTWQDNFTHDLPSESFKHVRQTSVRGFKSLILHAPENAKKYITKIGNILILVGSFMPQKPKLGNLNYESAN